MILLIIVVALLELVVARRFPVTEYTQVARSLDGSPCLTGCVNNQCVINWFGATASCKTYGPAPKYFTTQKRHPFAVHCLTNCGFFGYRREWCITSYDMHWDYCSSYVRESSSDPVTMTRYGDNCVTECSKQGKRFYWCWYLKHNGRRKWEFCAPAAEPGIPQVPVLPQDYNVGAMYKQSCDLFIKTEYPCVSVTTATDCRDNLVSNVAATFEAQNRATDCMKPVTSYSMVQFQNKQIPAVIRARITNETTHNVQHYQSIPPEVDSKYKQLLSGTYDVDYLIGCDLGGPYADYNFVPRSSNWNCDEWSDVENAMRSWCQRTGGYVDMVMVVFYSDGSTPMPRATGVSMAFKYADGSLHIDCREKMFWN